MSVGRGVLVVASVGALALLVRSLLIGPLPMPVAIAAMACYLAVALCGVFFPSLAMFGDVVCRGPRHTPAVALTFDNGPHPVHTRKVLDTLDATHAKATFFVLGCNAESHPDVVREITARGHEVGVRGFQQDKRLGLRNPRRIESDLKRAIDAVQHATGIRPTLFRPPSRWVAPRLFAVAERLELTIVGASVCGHDSNDGACSRDVGTRVRRGLKPGAIVQLHDAIATGDRCPAGVEALPAILDAAYARGLRCVSWTPFAGDEGSAASVG